MFDHSVVINLDKRPKRIAAFWRGFPSDWPFAKPERWPAVDGENRKPPSWFRAPRGAWGCYQSHLAIWRLQVEVEWDSMLIFEDDAVFARRLAPMMRDTLECLPDDWDQVYFGGQHLNTNDLPPEAVVQDKLIRGRYVNRTHAYAIRLPFARAALEAIDCPAKTSEVRLHHVDYRLCEMHATGDYNIYAPWRFYIGQSSGQSDIRSNRRGLGRHAREHFWNQFPIAELAVA